MATRVMVEVRAKPGTGADLIAFFRSILPDTRAHEGCTGVETLQNSDDPDHVILVEDWDSREQYERYIAWRREKGTSDQLREALAEPPVIRHFDVTDA